MKLDIRIFFFAIVVLVAAFCLVLIPGKPTQPSPKAPIPNVQVTQAGDVTTADFPDQFERHIKLPRFNPQLPEAPGRGTFLAMCATCHSLRYITMQPAFPRKVWIAEVNKMKKVFGASVNEKQVDEIVEYLMFLRGTKETEKSHG